MNIVDGVGLAELASRKYKSAAKNFLQSSFDNCECPEVSSKLFSFCLQLFCTNLGVAFFMPNSFHVFFSAFFRSFHPTMWPSMEVYVPLRHLKDRSFRRRSYQAGTVYSIFDVSWRRNVRVVPSCGSAV